MYVMPTPQLKVRSISAVDTFPFLCNQLNIGGIDQESSRTIARQPSGMTLGRFSGRPPPVMWAMAWTSTAVTSARVERT